MNKLTETRNGKADIRLKNWSLEAIESNVFILSGDAADRLAAYEATGLDPEQVKGCSARYEMAVAERDVITRHMIELEKLCGNLREELKRAKGEGDYEKQTRNFCGRKRIQYAILV